MLIISDIYLSINSDLGLFIISIKYIHAQPDTKYQNNYCREFKLHNHSTKIAPVLKS